VTWCEHSVETLQYLLYCFCVSKRPRIEAHQSHPDFAPYSYPQAPKLPVWKRDSPSLSPSGLGPVARVEQILQHSASTLYFIPSSRPLFIFYRSQHFLLSFHYRFALQLRGHVVIIAPPRYLLLARHGHCADPVALELKHGQAHVRVPTAL
jgi:hypothetical protein